MAPTLSTTVGLVFSAKAIRTFCYGYLGVLIPLHLAALGLGAEGIGVTVTLTLGASAVLTLPVRRPAERYGGRAVLMALASLIVVAGVLLATARVPGLVVGGDAWQRRGQHGRDGTIPVDRTGACGAG